MNASTDDLIQSIRKLALDEGDVVVVSSTMPLSKGQADQIQQKIERTIAVAGRKVQVLMLNHGLDIEVLKTSLLPKADAP